MWRDNHDNNENNYSMYIGITFKLSFNLVWWTSSCLAAIDFYYIQWLLVTSRLLDERRKHEIRESIKEKRMQLVDIYI